MFMSNKSGFVLIESILLFMIVCMITTILNLCAISYRQIEAKELDFDEQEENIKDIYQ